MSYLIFLKRLEDMDTAWHKNARCRGQDYRSLFSDHENCRWSYWSKLSGQEMRPHLRDKVFNFLRDLGGEIKQLEQEIQDEFVELEGMLK